MVVAVREVAIREIAVQDPTQALGAVLAFIEDEDEAQSLPLDQVDGVLVPSRVWVTTLGFQFEMGLEGLRPAAQPAQPAARLDKGGITSHFLVDAGVRSNAGNDTPSKAKNKAVFFITISRDGDSLLLAMVPHLVLTGA